MKINSYVMPETIEEAVALISQEGSTIIAGGAWLKLLPKTIETAVDLSKLQLDLIVETDKTIEIGAMVTLRQMETYPFIKTYGSGIISKAISGIMGMTIRNIATIGGSVAGQFGFSDILPVLLCLETKVELHQHGIITLENYLNNKAFRKSLLLKIIIDKNNVKGYHHVIKKTSNDFPVVTVAVTALNKQLRIAVGARPGGAVLAQEAMTYMNTVEMINQEQILQCSKIAVDELSFGTNHRGSAQYRQQVVEKLIARGIMEVTNGY